jgi:hypothetical protein
MRWPTSKQPADSFQMETKNAVACQVLSVFLNNIKHSSFHGLHFYLSSQHSQSWSRYSPLSTEPKVLFPNLQCSLSAPILSQMGPVHTLLTGSSKIHYNIILSVLLIPLSDVFPSGLPTKILCIFFSLPDLLHTPPISYLKDALRISGQSS